MPQVRFTLTAPNPKALRDEIAKYFRRYHPYGYGTKLDAKRDPETGYPSAEADIRFKDGEYVVTGTRWSSCD